jgi:hypothetical protein
METKLHNITDKFKAKFAASYNIYVIDYILNGERGRSGGILFLWNYCTCHVEIKDVNSNYINALVTNISNQMQWRATGVYGYPQHHNKHLTCELIQNLANNSFNNNWLLFGDFNLILNTNEKYGGNPMDTNTTSLFRDTLNLCGLQDLGYKGDIFTWNNRQEENQLIKARLDRFMANYNWISAFPNYSNCHLLRFKFDHSPILLDLPPFSDSIQHNFKDRPIRYEQAWTRDENHYHQVKETWKHIQGTTPQKLKATQASLHRWGNKRFGIIPKRIKAIQEDLIQLNNENGPKNLTNQIREKEAELDDLLESEELWWEQRARTMWLQHGDKNTRYFHMRANIRRQKNKIESINDANG